MNIKGENEIINLANSLKWNTIRWRYRLVWNWDKNNNFIYVDISPENIQQTWHNNFEIMKTRITFLYRLEGICLENCVAIIFHSSEKMNSPYQFCELADKQVFSKKTLKR